MAANVFQLLTTGSPDLHRLQKPKKREGRQEDKSAICCRSARDNSCSDGKNDHGRAPCGVTTMGWDSCEMALDPNPDGTRDHVLKVFIEV